MRNLEVIHQHFYAHASSMLGVIDKTSSKNEIKLIIIIAN
jgi:hypothetical protein